MTEESTTGTEAPESASILSTLERLNARLDEAEARAEQAREQATTAIADEVAAATERLTGRELSTPSYSEQPVVTPLDRFTNQNGEPWSRGDYELAMMMFEGTHRMSRPTNVKPPEDLFRAWRHEVFSDPNAVPWVANDDGTPNRALQAPSDYRDFTRAMDTAETGFGLELIGNQYVRDLWAAARNEDGIVDSIPRVTMTDPTMFIPIDGALPEMLFVGESTDASATAYTTSKTASNRRQFDAKKFTIQQIWSTELNEDSIIAFTPFLRRQLNISAALHVGSAVYNGDTTNAGTGNINSDDADPADTKHYLAFDGIRHYWLVDTTGQGANAAGALTQTDLWDARGRLNGTDDDVDAAVGNINWGTRARDLRLVADWATFMKLHEFDDFSTIDKYGARATVVTGELGSANGIPIVSPGYATKTEADGKASTTEASNTLGQVTVFNPQGFILGVRRDTQLFFDRIQRTDQFLFELYMRLAFNRFGENVAAGIYNITV